MSNDEALAIVSSDGILEDALPSVSLAFVNVGAVSQEERLRNQKLIRSTAMKSFRRRQQSERSQKSEESSKSTPKPKSPRPKSKRSSKSDEFVASPILITESSSEVSFSEVSWLKGRPSNDRKNDHFGFVDSNRCGSLSSRSSRPPSVLESPITPLGAGRVDPFRLLPVDSSSHINELIDHSVTHLWPGLRPRRSNSSESKISSAWLEKVYERPVVMHALLFGAAVHIDVLRSPRLSLDNPTRLYHKVQTMRLLKEELKSPEKTPLDEVLLAVLCLASNEVETVANNMKKKIRSPFNSPLTSAQWLDIYGSITHIHTHTIAMRSLVSRRGGLEKIELEGLAEVLSFSDILGATQSLSKPHWPLLDRTKTSKIDTPNRTGSRLGRRFQDLLSLGITDAAVNVFQDMADLTTIIDDHCRGKSFIPNITLLIDHRNAVQHNLLSLPRGDELEQGEVSSTSLYDSIRHTAIIYSAAVTFPLPPLTGIFRKFAVALKTIMEESKFDPSWQLCPKVILWILIMGGIAATQTPERTWYVHNIATISLGLNISEWEDVEKELGNYLWLESACDAGGCLLWMEVINYRVAKERESSDIPEFRDEVYPYQSN